MPNLGTTQGLVSWYQNVYAEAAPMLRGLGGGNSRGGITNLGGVRYQGRPVQSVTQTVSPSGAQMKHWFQGLANQMDSMDMETKLAYWAAGGQGGRYTGRSGPTLAMQDFIDQYGGGLGAPTAQTISSLVPVSQTRGQRFLQHFMNNRGSGLSGSLIGGLKGGLAGSAVDALMGGGEAGAAGGLMAGGGMGALMGGGLVAGGVGALVVGVVKAIGSQIGQGMKSFTDTIPAFSQLSHALFNASNSAVGFQESVQMAGARVAMTPIQSTQTAQTLAMVFGKSANLANLVQQTGANAILNGLSPSEQTQMVAAAGQLGITNGRGASMSPSQYNQMFLNMVKQSGMQGRQGPLGTGLLSVYSGLGAMSPVITSANSTAAIYTAMNRSGVQGLQGTNGANILSQMNSTIGSGQGLGGIMSMAAIYQASGGKVTNPWQMQAIMEQGLGAHIGNGTLGSQMIKMVQQMAPGNIYTQAGLLASISGISENQAIQMIRSGALNAQNISELSNQTTRLTISQQNTSASAKTQIQAGKLGYMKSLLNNAAAKIAGGSNYVSATGVAGNIYNETPIPPAQQQAIKQAVKNHVSMSNSNEYNQLYGIMQSIAMQESSGNPYVINDNTTGKSYRYGTRSAYLSMANKLTKEHHQLALGTYQLENFHKGVNPLSAINPTWSANEALKILLNGQNPNTMTEANWQTALENYSGNMPGYAKSVLGRASQIENSQNGTEVSLSPTTLNALGSIIAQEMHKLQATLPRR